MAKVLDRIMQKVEVEPTEQDNGRKAYSNMMVYLKELKLHNVKNLELAEQIFELSENSVEKLNEMREIIAERFDGDEEEEKQLLTLLQQTTAIQAQTAEIQKQTERLQNQMNALSVMQTQIEEISGLQDHLQEMENRICTNIRENASERVSLDSYGEVVQNAVDKVHEQITETMENDAKVLKREMNVMNENFEDSVQERIGELEDGMNHMKKTLTIYMRVLMWAAAIVIVLLVFQLLPL